MQVPDVQYVSNEAGEVTSVLVPVEVWREIASEIETKYLLASPAMRRRLDASLGSKEGVSFDETLAQLGVDKREL